MHLTNKASSKVPGDRFSYQDYFSWTDEKRVELIDGLMYELFPGPNRAHQLISGKLFTKIFNHLDGKACQVYAAPFDVRLPIPKEKTSDGEIYNVVQPDICVICDLSKLDERGCVGPPDLVIEILSPGSSKKDLKLKHALYERAEVREYWVVSPMEKSIQVFLLAEKGPTEKGAYILDTVFEGDDLVASRTLPGMSFEVAALF